MSVYRMLDFLRVQGFVHRLESANKYVACTQINCKQTNKLSQFLICEQCQWVEEVSIPATTVEKLESAINKTGFHINNPQLEINGICSHCFSS